MKNTTLLFLVKKNENNITEVLLAMKKRGFGAGRWNGVGGKIQGDETIEQALIREAKEEIDVDVSRDNLVKVAELEFHFPHQPDFDQIVHTYISDTWQGEPIESEEMKPEWFDAHAIPFDDMWPDDRYWIPQMIEGKLIKGGFTFGEGDVVLKQDVNVVDSF